MFKKKGLKKSKDMPENNNSSGDEELSDDELFNVAGGMGTDLSSEEWRRYNNLGKKYSLYGNLESEENAEYRALMRKATQGCHRTAFSVNND